MWLKAEAEAEAQTIGFPQLLTYLLDYATTHSALTTPEKPRYTVVCKISSVDLDIYCTYHTITLSYLIFLYQLPEEKKIAKKKEKRKKRKVKTRDTLRRRRTQPPALLGTFIRRGGQQRSVPVPRKTGLEQDGRGEERERSSK